MCACVCQKKRPSLLLRAIDRSLPRRRDAGAKLRLADALRFALPLRFVGGPQSFGTCYEPSRALARQKKITILSCQHWELGRLPLAGDAGHFKMRMDNLDITARRDIPPGVPVIDDIWTRSTRHCRTGQLQGPTVPYVPVVGTSVGCSLCCRQKRPARSTL